MTDRSLPAPRRWLRAVLRAAVLLITGLTALMPGVVQSADAQTGAQVSPQTPRHEWTTAGAGWIRFAWRSSLEPVSESIFSIRSAGEFDGVGRIDSAGEHEGDSLVHGFNSLSFGISAADFKWAARIRPSRPVDRTAGN
jgi:hypothetical protein